MHLKIHYLITRTDMLYDQNGILMTTKDMAITEKRLAEKPLNSTEFALYKAFLSLATGFPRSKLLDFSEHKLVKLIKHCRDNDRKLMLIKLLGDYKLGKVAIAWESGDKPLYINVTKG